MTGRWESPNGLVVYNPQIGWVASDNSGIIGTDLYGQIVLINPITKAIIRPFSPQEIQQWGGNKNK